MRNIASDTCKLYTIDKCTLRIFQNVMINAVVATAISTLRGRINPKKVTVLLRLKQIVVGVSAITYPSCRLMRAGRVGYSKASSMVVM